MDLAAARTAVKNRLATISGLTAYDTVPGSPQVPCVIVRPELIDLSAVFDVGPADVRFALQVLVQLSDWASAQNALDAYISTGTSTSIADAFNAGAPNAAVLTADGYGHVDYGEVTFACVTFHVVVLA